MTAPDEPREQPEQHRSRPPRSRAAPADRWDASALPSAHGKTVVVTGANAGIGYFTSEQLARAGAHVVLACRDQERAEAAVSAIRRRVRNASVEATPLDVADRASVDHAAEVLLGRGRRGCAHPERGHRASAGPAHHGCVRQRARARHERPRALPAGRSRAAGAPSESGLARRAARVAREPARAVSAGRPAARVVVQRMEGVRPVEDRRAGVRVRAGSEAAGGRTRRRERGCASRVLDLGPHAGHPRGQPAVARDAVRRQPAGGVEPGQGSSARTPSCGRRSTRRSRAGTSSARGSS